MSLSGKENWNKSVGCIVIKEDKILLVKHTYGKSKGIFCLPGGYINKNETPQDGAVREIREETGIETVVKDIIAVRFNPQDWYIVFTMDYISGEIFPDKEEISEAAFINPNEALTFNEITGLTRVAIEMYIKNPEGVFKRYIEYSKEKGDDYSLYGVNNEIKNN